MISRYRDYWLDGVVSYLRRRDAYNLPLGMETTNLLHYTYTVLHCRWPVAVVRFAHQDAGSLGPLVG